MTNLKTPAVPAEPVVPTTVPVVPTTVPVVAPTVPVVPSAVTPTPSTTPSTAPPVVKPKEIDQSAVKKNAAYFTRNPEEFEAVLGELEKAGQVQIKQDVADLRRELTIRDAISDHGLTRADAAFITGTTSEEINTSAAALKARLTPVPVDPLKPGETVKPGAPVKPVDPLKPGDPAIVKPTEPVLAPVPPLPQHTGALSSKDQAEADFLVEAAGWCAEFDMNNLGHK